MKKGTCNQADACFDYHEAHEDHEENFGFFILRDLRALRGKNPGAVVSGAICVLALSISAALAQSPPDRPADRTKPATSSKRTDDLSKRLLRKAMKQGDEDVMETILRLMEESGRKIDMDSDPGPATQEKQQEIVDKLDQAIRAAAKNQRRVSQSMPSSSSDMRRRMQPAARPKETPPKPEGQPTGEEASIAGQDGGASPEVEPKTGPFTDIRRAWGNLPAREREELIQGRGEEYLERYRAWVERYYRALQEAGGSEGR